MNSKTITGEMSAATREKVWNYLEVAADNALLRAELEKLKLEKRDLEQNHQTITRLAEQQALELLQLKQGLAARTKWKCELHTGIKKEQYEKLLNDGWNITHRQFEAGALMVVAEKQEPIDPPVRETLAEKKARLNAAIMGTMMGAFDAAGGNRPITSIEEMTAYGRGTRGADAGADWGNSEAAGGDFIITVTQH